MSQKERAKSTKLQNWGIEITTIIINNNKQGKKERNWSLYN